MSKMSSVSGVIRYTLSEELITTLDFSEAQHGWLVAWNPKN